MRPAYRDIKNGELVVQKSNWSFWQFFSIFQYDFLSFIIFVVFFLAENRSIFDQSIAHAIVTKVTSSTTSFNGMAAKSFRKKISRHRKTNCRNFFFRFGSEIFFFRQKLDESKFWFRLVKMVGPRIIFLWLPVLLFRCWNWVVTSLSLFPTREDWAAHHHAHSPSPILSLSLTPRPPLSPPISLSLSCAHKS